MNRPKQRGTASVSAQVLRRAREKRGTSRMPPVACPSRVKGVWKEDATLDTVSSAMYLGCKVSGGPKDSGPVQHRVDLGGVALQKHWRFWGDKQASLKMKMSAYRMYITSVVCHGYEGWYLGEKECKILNGFDLRAQMLFTGWDYDVVAATREFSLVEYVRERRIKFLGHTLRLDPGILVHKVLAGYHHHLVNLPHRARGMFEGTIFADAPNPQNFEGLVVAAKDRSGWTRSTRRLLEPQRRASRRISAGVRPGQDDANERPEDGDAL